MSTNSNGRIKVVDELLTTNISTGGVFLQIDNPLPIDTAVNLKIIHSLNGEIESNEKGKMTKIAGSVLRIDKRGMAIRFDGDFAIKSLVRTVEYSRN